jgi:hypothetical protein
MSRRSEWSEWLAEYATTCPIQVAPDEPPCPGDAAVSAEPTVTISVSEYEDLLEIKAATEGLFPRCLIVKPERDRDLYVGWSEVCGMPAGMWTRAEAISEGCPPSRLRRADERGTSSLVPGVYDWDSPGMIAEQRGWLPRARLAEYATAWLEGRHGEALDLLEPISGDEDFRPGHHPEEG